MNHRLTMKPYIHLFLLPEGAPVELDPELTKFDRQV